MKTTLQHFIDTVTKSRALSADQKELFLEDPEGLPETYREKVAGVLTEFDRHSVSREQDLRQKLEEGYRQFAQRLEFEGIEGEERKKLLEKARKQIESIFPVNHSSV